MKGGASTGLCERRDARQRRNDSRANIADPPATWFTACPEHTEKGPLFEPAAGPAVGITITDSYAMLPTAASPVALFLAIRTLRILPSARLIGPAWRITPRQELGCGDAERWARSQSLESLCNSYQTSS